MGVAPSVGFLRRLSETFPDVVLRWDNHRGQFVLWERTRSGHMAVIQDVPKGHTLGQQILDHLTMCSLAARGGMQNIINSVDEMADRVREAEIAKAKQPDPERLLWGLQREFRDVLSVPLGVRVQVPKGAPS